MSCLTIDISPFILYIRAITEPTTEKIVMILPIDTEYSMRGIMKGGLSPLTLGLLVEIKVHHSGISEKAMLTAERGITI